MNEDFHTSPRALKRRKLSKHDPARSAKSERVIPVSSRWEHVSKRVAGLSRRLFTGNRPTTYQDDFSSALHDDNRAEGEAQEYRGETVEIEESESESSNGTSLANLKPGRQRIGSASEQIPVGINTKPKMVNGQSGRTQSAHRKPAATAQNQQVSGNVASASARLPEGNYDAVTNSAEVSTTTGIVTKDAEDDRIVIQPRVSGRERKGTRKYDSETIEVQQKSKSATRIHPKQGASKQNPTGSKKAVHPKSIALTPSQRHEKKSGRIVAPDESEKQLENELGFKDISSSERELSRPSLESQQNLKTPQSWQKSNDKPPKDIIMAQPSLEAETLIEEGSLLKIIPSPMPLIGDSSSQGNQAHLDQDPPELQRMKAAVLARLTYRASYTERPPLPSYLKGAYDTLHTLLRTTVLSGESNSLLLLGSRGAGTSLLVDTALGNLQRDLSTNFHVVRLNGFVQTDDRLALREIWRQLGHEMDIDEDETNQVVGSYADTMTSLLGLLSQPEEVPDIGAVEYVAEKVVTRSVVFILDEFDLFTTHPRQTLLYNLFDIAQSRKAPIAVIGCSARADCVESLEKRVKSRFSHRWVYVDQPKSVTAFEEVVRDNLLVDEKRIGCTKHEQEWAVTWNEYINSTFLPSALVQSLIGSSFYTTKSLPDLFAALYTLIADAAVSAVPGPGTLAAGPPSLLSLLASLPHIHLALLVCAARLEVIHLLTQLNFNIIYMHYTDLLTKSRLEASTSGTSGAMRPWGRDVSLRAWEELVQWELLAKVGTNNEGIAEHCRMYRVDVSIEEVRWAVEMLGTGTGEGLARWCREI